MPKPRLAIVVLAAVLGVASQLVAQQEVAPKGLEVVPAAGLRNGFWAGVGLGVGYERFSTPALTIDPGWLARPTLNFRVGGTPNQHLRLGGETIFWFNNEGSISQSLGGVAAIAQLYPAATLGFFLKGGGGFGWNSYSDGYYPYQYTISYESGFMWSVGGGWEIPVSRKINIVPTVDYYGMTFGSRSSGDHTEEVWNFGVAVQIP
jgi:hypothetical protein